MPSGCKGLRPARSLPSKWVRGERIAATEQENRIALERLVRAFRERDADEIADLVHEGVVEDTLSRAKG
jgi:hypothetical protein